MENAKDYDIVFTNKARCRDCYRCVRVCPVKAIKIEGNQASVVQERCIHCGTCVRECPQNAKSYRRDTEKVKELLKNKTSIAVSVAPAFAAVFEDWQAMRIPAALRRLGFDYVAETAVGARIVANTMALNAEEARDTQYPSICSACPAVVNYIEKYSPNAHSQISKVVSPMIAHGAFLKRENKADKVVFVGPCVAKKMEAQREETAGIIDAVITFEELKELFEEFSINLAECEESSFDQSADSAARLFPIENGNLFAAAFSDSLFEENTLALSGPEDVEDLLLNIDKLKLVKYIEPLFCKNGCISGPGISDDNSVLMRKQKLLAYANKGNCQLDDLTTNVCFDYHSTKIETAKIEENQIRQVLEQTGKESEENQLNCGACGYPDCRTQAIAVLEGMAETEMCIPYMRRLAEQRSDKIMETSPNGIVILDSHLNILSFNPMFRKMFSCTDGVMGRNISYLMDPEPFELIASGKSEADDNLVNIVKYKLTCRRIIYPLKDEKQYVAVFIDLTAIRKNSQQLKRIKFETVEQAKELYELQMKMAQNFAQFLGEYTAKGELLIDKIVEVAKD